MKSDALLFLKIISVYTLALLLLITFLSEKSDAKKQIKRNIQEVNFSDMNLNGTLRNPDGAYLVQKSGIKFKPLYEVQKDLATRIRETALY